MTFAVQIRTYRRTLGTARKPERFARKNANFLRTADAAHYLGISAWSLRNLAKSGKLAYRRIGNVLLFSPTELDRYIRETTEREPEL